MVASMGGSSELWTVRCDSFALGHQEVSSELSIILYRECNIVSVRFHPRPQRARADAGSLEEGAGASSHTLERGSLSSPVTLTFALMVVRGKEEPPPMRATLASVTCRK